MATTQVPNNTLEREQLCAAITAWRADPNTSTTLLELDRQLFLTPCGDWQLGRIEVQELAADWQHQIALTQAADRVFDEAMRAVGNTFVDSSGRRDVESLRSLMDGATPGDVVQMAPAREVRLARSLLSMCSQRSDLNLDPMRLQALQAATDSLDTAVQARDEARRNKEAAGMRMSALTERFDRGWVALLTVLRRALTDDQIKAAFPTFVRKDRKASAAA